jgi:toxin secretion/phage lysis holin
MIQGILEDLPAAFRLELAGLGTVEVYLFGGWDAILKALIDLVAIDFVTGVLAAYTEKKLNSEVGYKGILRKVCIFLMVAVAQIIDTSSGLGEPLLRMAVIISS